jgi:hypothetical protein
MDEHDESLRRVYLCHYKRNGKEYTRKKVVYRVYPKCGRPLGKKWYPSLEQIDSVTKLITEHKSMKQIAEILEINIYKLKVILNIIYGKSIYQSLNSAIPVDNV